VCQPGIQAVNPALATIIGALFMTAWAQTAPVSMVLEAEEYSGLQGTTYSQATNFSSVDGFGNGDWVRFDSINFADGAFDSITVSYWCSWPNDGTNSRIRIRIDSQTGAILGTIGAPVPGTGDHMHYGSSRIATTLTLTTGIHNLYLTFEGNANICDLDKIRLSGSMTISAADTKTYYVATDGSDANDGLSIDHPFKTIQKAANTMKPGSTCRIRQGIYRETVRPLYAGCAGAPLVFEPYGGDQVYISGADPLSGWTVHNGSMYKASMPWSLGKYKDQLIIDGKMAWVARCPNVDETYQPHPYLSWCGNGFGVYNWKKWQNTVEPIAVPMRGCWWVSGTAPSFSASISNDPAPNQLPATLFSRPANFFQGGLVTLHSFYWQHAGIITGSQSTASQTSVTATNTDLAAPNQSGPGWVSYVLGLLDAPNEWYRDSASSTVYLWSPDGGDPSHHMVEAKRRILGFDLRGKQYVTVKGIRFLATSLTMANASNCIVDGCRFKYVSHNDVPPTYEMGTTYQIKQNANPGHLGIYVSGDRNIIRTTSVCGSAASGIIVGGSYNTITNCRISACDYSVTYHAGILVQKRDWNDPLDAVGISINHNSLSFNARGDIQVGSASTPRNAGERLKIEYNDFGAAAYTTTESGSLAGQAALDVEVSRNWFHDVNFPANGHIEMESDFGAWKWKVHHNVFWEGKGPIEDGRRGFDWTFTFDDTSWMCFNNTVVDSVQRGNHSDWEYMCGFLPGTQTIDPNAPWAGTTNRNLNNLWPTGDTSYWKFTDPVNRDYSLRAGSPAIAKGVVIPGWVTTNGGQPPSLGAYEFGQPRWVAGADWQETSWVYPPLSSSKISRLSALPAGPLRASLRVTQGRIEVLAPQCAQGRLMIHDARGALVAARDMLKGKTIIETNALSAGVYLVRLRQAGVLSTWKVLLR
jgi:hypothetical protein